MLDLVLASSSPFRRQLLEKLGLPFQWQAPEVDESALADEAPQELALRLAEMKAKALADSYPNALLIGSDQVAMLDGEQLHKPGQRQKAIAQLQKSSGRTLHFYTGLCLYNSASQTSHTWLEPYTVTFRQLTDAQITAYVDKEQPFGSAGSFKSEGLGISLFESITGNDPNALVGLPLIGLCQLLAREGVDPLSGSTLV